MRDENQVFAEWRAAREAQKHGAEAEQRCVLELELISLMSQHAYAICYLKLGERRPDIVNLAIMRALQNAEKFRGDAKFSTWFQEIVQNLCNEALKRKILKRQREVSVEEMNEGQQAELAHTPDFDTGIRLEQMFEGLSTEDKEFISLKQEGLSETEMADRLGTNANNIRQKWWRIKGTIRRNLEKRGIPCTV